MNRSEYDEMENEIGQEERDKDENMKRGEKNGGKDVEVERRKSSMRIGITGRRERKRMEDKWQTQGKSKAEGQQNGKRMANAWQQHGKRMATTA